MYNNFQNLNEDKKNNILNACILEFANKGYDKAFQSVLKDIARDESEVQSQKFIAENRLQLDVNRDVWVLYSKHGPSLYYNKMDFTIINSPSMWLEVKHYMKHRFMAVNRIKDRFLSQVAYAVNLLTTHNTRTAGIPKAISDSQPEREAC